MVVYIFSCVYLIAIATLRYRLGGDTIGYEWEYRSIPTLWDIGSYKFSSLRWEPGFILLFIICKTISPEFVFFQFVHAVILNCIIFWFISKNTQNRFIAVTLYFVIIYFNLNMEVLREALAVSLFLLAWPSFRDGKWYIYYPLMLLACTFHISAAITLILPLLLLPGIRAGFKLGYRTIFICAIIFVICLIVQRNFFGLIKLLSPTETIADRADVYAKSDYGGTNLNIVGMLEYIFTFVFIPLMALWYMKKKVKAEESAEKSNSIKKIEVLIVIGAYFAVTTLVILIAQRFNNYICMFNYTLMASCFFTSLKIKRKKYKIPAYYWSLILFVVLIVNSMAYRASVYGSQSLKRYMVYYPYASVIDNTEDPQREEIYRFGSHKR